MPLLTGQILHGNRYRIAKLIGQGGFGSVYRAWDLTLNQPVALKENLDTSQEAQRQFEHEAQILAGLRHPNLPRVIDHFFIFGQGQYLVMDFVEGNSASELLAGRQGHPFSEAEVLPWLRQVCAALDYLHKRQPPIIHRDIKPENIIITPEGQAMLVDFGISKIYDAQLATTVGAQAVTPGYSPPEQYGVGKTDARTDVYALGATLYRLLTGIDPPPSVDIVAGTVNLTPPCQLNQRLSPAVEQAILKAMSTNISQRFSRTADLLAAVTATFSDSPPVIAPNPISHSPSNQRPDVFTPITRPSSPDRKFWFLSIIGPILLILFIWMGTRPANNGQKETSSPTTAQIAKQIIPTEPSHLVPTTTSIPTSAYVTPTFRATLLPQPTNTPLPATSPPITISINCPPSIVFCDDFSSNPNTNGLWTIFRGHGDAQNESSWDEELRALFLTRAADSKYALVLANYDLTAKQWTATFRYKVGGGDGADGFAFWFYRAADDSFTGYEIEFDSYYNANNGDHSANHIAIKEDGKHLVYVDDSRTEDDTWHQVEVKFSNGRLTIFIDNSMLLDYLLENPDYTYPGIGFSARTGADNNNHIIDDFSLRIEAS